jgi:hypothetical protein
LAVEPPDVDQRHRPFDERLAFKERLVGMGDDIDDRIADAEDIEGSVVHRRMRGLLLQAAGL